MKLICKSHRSNTNEAADAFNSKIVDLHRRLNEDDMQHIRRAALTLMLLLLQTQQALSRRHMQLLLMYFLFRRRNEIYSAATALKLKARPIRRRRRFWAIRRPQLLFEHRVINRMLDCTWKEHFRVDRSTFFYIVHLVAID